MEWGSIGATVCAEPQPIDGRIRSEINKMIIVEFQGILFLEVYGKGRKAQLINHSIFFVIRMIYLIVSIS